MQIGTQAPRSAPEYWDVAVMGAGPAGIAAACTAARNGLRTLLVEAGEKIGGVMSSCPGMMLGAGYPLGRSIGGLFEEFTQRLYQADPPRAERRVCAIFEFGPEVIYDPDYALFQLYAMLEEAGAQLRLSTRMESVTMKGDRIASVRLFGPEGMREVQAGVWLDCTGNGDLAAAAGVPFQLGDKNGSMMGATLTFFMEQVDWEKSLCPAGSLPYRPGGKGDPGGTASSGYCGGLRHEYQHGAPVPYFSAGLGLCGAGGGIRPVPAHLWLLPVGEQHPGQYRAPLPLPALSAPDRPADRLDGSSGAGI
ncbi:FAD-dependent oxidoreductase [Fournierella massiliensis]|nr:FAD-dependent oxidoreductase [Fournierella massiliensis]MCF2558270.1 FAD-dependent oxidoreductase [Fournierella massiliensis]